MPTGEFIWIPSPQKATKITHIPFIMVS
jgi:hypothetical protein